MNFRAKSSRLAAVSIAVMALVLARAGVARGGPAPVLRARQDTPRMHPRAAPEIQGDRNTLVLPKLTGPQLPPPPPALRSPNIPSAFLGCWQGNPRGFDWVRTDFGLVDVGGPGKIIFCYARHQITVPEAHVRISAEGHALDWLAHLGLGFSSFTEQGATTEIYTITPTQMSGRTNLVIDHTDHWFYVLPLHDAQPSRIAWIATATGNGGIMVQAEQVVYASGMKMWGAWHAVFHRVGEAHKRTERPEAGN